MLISSPDNPLLKKIRKAAAGDGLTDDGLAIAEGPHLVEEAIRSGLRIHRILVADNAPDFGFGDADVVHRHIFSQIKGTEHSQGVIALVQAPVWNLSDIAATHPGLVVVLDSIQDPGNAGTIIRSAEAFGATGVVMLKGSVYPWNLKCLRASAGSLFRVPVVYGVTDFSLLDGFTWFAAAGEASQTIDVVDWMSDSVLVIGNEAAGVKSELKDRSRKVRIPVQGVESLNAAVASGVILYEARRQRSAPILRTPYKDI